MLELKIHCDTHEDVRVYLNAHQYLNLITDFANAMHSERKHGQPGGAQKLFDTFYDDFQRCALNSLEGPY